MTVKRLIVAMLVFSLAPALGACSQFSDYVSDHWPHWAGGMPPDVPPRPGAPGYDQFITHGEAPQPTAPVTAAPQAAPAPQTTATVATRTTMQPAPATVTTTTIRPAPPAAAPPEPEVSSPDDAAYENSSVRQGGLY